MEEMLHMLFDDQRKAGRDTVAEEGIGMQ